MMMTMTAKVNMNMNIHVSMNTNIIVARSSHGAMKLHLMLPECPLCGISACSVKRTLN